jgi:uncharacterized protein (DUF488 family)
MPPDAVDANAPTIYSIGHSNHTLVTFLGLLQRHGVQTLVDIRSQPYSRYATHFNRHELESMVEGRNIKYVYLGGELGGRPIGEEFYDDERHVLYARLAESRAFREGIARLLDDSVLARTAMMCSEEDPTECHRRLLIARVLEGQNVVVHHIRGDGRLQTERDLEVPIHRAPAQQLSLFEDPNINQEEDVAWRSIRPVSPRKPQPNSSNPSDEWASDDW